MCVNSKGSGETARIDRLACLFAGRLYDKYHNLMSWRIQSHTSQEARNFMQTIHMYVQIIKMFT